LWAKVIKDAGVKVSNWLGVPRSGVRQGNDGVKHRTSVAPTALGARRMVNDPLSPPPQFGLCD